MRKFVIALVGALITALVSSVAIAPAATAAAKRPTVVSVRLDKLAVAQNQYFQVTGNLGYKGSTKKLPGQTVTLVARTHTDGTGFKAVASTRTGANGAYKFRIKGVRNWDLYVKFGGTSALAASASSIKLITVKVALRVTSSPAGPAAVGEVKTLNGTTSAALRGKTAIIQRQYGTTWRSVGKTTINAKGAFRWSYRLKDMGIVTFRVALPATPTLGGNVSGAFRYNIQRWYYLRDLPYVSSENINNVFLGSWRVSGRTYSQSIQIDVGGSAPTQGTVSYDLRRKCSVFRADVGIDDVSASDTRHSFIVDLDGAAVSETEKLFSQTATPLSISLSQGLRLNLINVVSVGDGDNDELLWGNARVLCSF